MADDEREQERAPLRALPISPGIALGPVRLLDIIRASSGRERVEVEQIADERQRLQAAIVAAEEELDKLYAQVARTVGQTEAEIFVAQKLMLRDPELLDEVEELMVRRLFAADTAWSQVVKRQSAELAVLGDATLAARAADVRDMGDRVLNHLQSKASSENAARAQQEPALLVAYDLTPSQTAELNPASILGICTVEGGPTTHAAIIARALEIPAVAGLDARVLSSLQACQEMAIGGGRGLVDLQPEGTQRERVREAMET